MPLLSPSMKRQLQELGLTPIKPKDARTLGAELTICQMIVVVLALSSAAFIIIPVFFLKNIFFIVFGLILSLIFLYFGVWFWIHRREICEDPEKLKEIIMKEHKKS